MLPQKHPERICTEAELRDFKEEMQAANSRSELDRKSLHEEMKTFKEEIRRENREMNRKWGELANKMGTMVEDLVAPTWVLGERAK